MRRPDLELTEHQLSRRALLGASAATIASALFATPGLAAPRPAIWREVRVPVSSLARETGDPLPSWRDGPRKQAILDFVAAATYPQTKAFVPDADRIATFDLDGTLWIEQPLYVQSTFTVERIRALAADHPEWATMPPFAKVITGEPSEITALTNAEWQTLMGASHAGLTIERYVAAVAAWLASRKHPRFDRLYTELVYQPMLEVMAYLRANAFRTYIVSGSGQEFIRAFADPVLGIPPEQVVGTSFQTTYATGSNGSPSIVIDAPVLADDNGAGKPRNINLVIGRRPVAAFGNSGGDQQMLEWTGAGSRAALMMLVHHDDGEREYAYGPAGGLPDSHVGTFSAALLSEANASGWSVISMKSDWTQVFPDRHGSEHRCRDRT
jgi:phosphoglycolate phosphatase-like HAD superfamily hydrolase